MSPKAPARSELLERRAVCAACEHCATDRELARSRGDRHVHYCAFPGREWPCITAAFLRGPLANCGTGAWGNPGTGTEHVGTRPPMWTDTLADTTVAPAVAGVAQPPPAVGAVGLEHASVCIYAEPDCSGCKARPKIKCAKHGVVLNAAACADPGCSDRLPLSELHIGAVITAWNEGDEVRLTIESLRGSVKEARVTICLVDDASTDKSCMTLLRNEKALGVGGSRNVGWEAARKAGCHVVSFHDAHMRFGPDEGGSDRVLERLAIKAMRERAIISSASRDITGKGVLAGCWMHYDPRQGIQPKYQHADRYLTGPAPWKRMPCMMGAGYVMSVETAQMLEDATGSLWEDTAGRWGLSEQALSIKAYLLGIPVLVNQDLVIAHRYKAKNPTPDAGPGMYKNLARMAAVLFGPQTYAERFADWCEGRVPPSQLAPILAEAFAKNAIGGRWAVDPATVWTHLLGEGAPITAPHPDHAWLPQIEAACREIAARKPNGRGARVFIWRPGEAMVLVRRLLPDAEISAVEIQGHRFETWKSLCKRLKVKLTVGNLAKDYAVPPVKEFDLILVSGEMQEACTAAAWLEGAANGHLLVNPSANRRQLESSEREKEAAALAGPTTGQPPVISPVGAAAPAVTIVLLSWKRPDNLAPILDSIAAQTVRAQVMIWNNGAPLPDAVARHPLVVSVVSSMSNLGCLPRWWLASQAKTEWICSLDDDLAFASPDALEFALGQARALAGIVGAFGVQLIQGRSYRDAHHVQSGPVDVVKGRFMLFRRELLERVPMLLPGLDLASGQGDDILVSLCVGRGRARPHALPGGLRAMFQELPAGKVGVEAQPGHWAGRQKAVEAVSSWVRARP